MIGKHPSTQKMSDCRAVCLTRRKLTVRIRSNRFLYTDSSAKAISESKLVVRVAKMKMW